MDKAKQKLIDKLGKKGFDTEKKVNAIDMQVAFDNGLTDELGGILALQKAIKTHSVYAFLMDGVDAKPEKKEAKHDHDRKPGDGNEEGNIY
ncbi:MAG: hypothetical protein IJH62_06530 [Mogibacterium sp.]|nr:hypothetical protein [Mogibacterium sp.]